MSMAVIQPLVGGRLVLSTKPKPTVTTASTCNLHHDKWDKQGNCKHYVQVLILALPHSG